MNYEIELTRHNVTPAKFFAEIRFACKKKGIDFGLDLDAFKEPGTHWNSHYRIEGNKKIGRRDGYEYTEELDPETLANFFGLTEEVCRCLPYDDQSFLRYANGAVYNEICEFTFDDEKTGTGYYYQMNLDAKEETA